MLNTTHDLTTLGSMRAALAALPPEYDDVRVLVLRGNAPVACEVTLRVERSMLVLELCEVDAMGVMDE